MGFGSEDFGTGVYGRSTIEASHEETEDLASGLPGYLPRSEGRGHWNLMYPVGVRVNEAEHDIKSVDFAQNVQNAETMDQLAKLGAMFELPPNEGEGKAHYRARLLAEGMLATSEGTINDVIIGASEILDVDAEDIDYFEPIKNSTENGTASVHIPNASLSAAELTQGEVAAFLDKLASLGCRIEGFVSGTFTYITPSDYNASNFDATLGYDGLDVNGDPKDNGGTYAGVI